MLFMSINFDLYLKRQDLDYEDLDRLQNRIEEIGDRLGETLKTMRDEENLPLEVWTSCFIEPRPILEKRLPIESTSFFAERLVASTLGEGVEVGRSLFLIFEDEATARRADELRAAELRYAEIKPKNLLLFCDGKAGLEWKFPDRWEDADVFLFCRVFEASGVKVCLAGGISSETQRQILRIFGMKEGIST